MAGTYFEPTTVADAVGLLDGDAAGAAIVAGGTDLVVAHRGGRKALPDILLAVHRIGEMDGIEEASDGSVRLGGNVTFANIESSSLLTSRYTALVDAASLVGSPATRHVGTVAGNLCNASPAMETGSPLLVFEASVNLSSAAGDRVLSVANFVTGPGSTALSSGELLTAVSFPAPPEGRIGSAYLRLEYRQAMEIAVVGAAALVGLDADASIREVRLALTAVAPTCIRVSDAEAALRGKMPTDDAFVEAGHLAAAMALPIGDVRASADYRRAMVPVIVGRALSVAARRASGEDVPIPASRVFGK